MRHLTLRCNSFGLILANSCIELLLIGHRTGVDVAYADTVLLFEGCWGLMAHLPSDGLGGIGWILLIDEGLLGSGRLSAILLVPCFVFHG